ncbi:MAG TPA: 30S ribosomal protein S8 [Desulfotomaculum sp.]|nr:30S ribosomal protein S8 [Desulfotomaculum sp.]
MAMTDPVADFLTRVRNANMACHDKVEIPASKTKKAITVILKEEGFIKDYEFLEESHRQGTIKIYLKYGPNKQRVITGIKRISKPGLRVYVRKIGVPRVLGGLGVAIISTSKGILTDRQARKMNLGGEIICYVW